MNSNALPKPRLPLVLRNFLVFGLICLLTVSCSQSSRDENFLLITLDTQRFDYVNACTEGKARTPNLDALAHEGILYENCYSLIPITLPSHASIFFSQPPYEVKNYNNGQIIQPRKSRPSFVKMFKKHGYTTAAFISLGVLKSEFGLDEGFDLYSEDFPASRWYTNADEVNSSVFPWLERLSGQKFFAWIHYSDPHDPYSPPYLPNDLKLVLNEEVLSEHNFSSYQNFELEIPLSEGKNELRFELDNTYTHNPDGFIGRFDRMEWDFLGGEDDLNIDFFWGWFNRVQDEVIFFKRNAYINIDNPSSPRTIRLIFRGKPLLTVEGVRELYKQEVEYMDQAIGRLWDKLKSLGLYKKTHILVVGDHGEGLGEFRNAMGDPHIGHVHFLYDIYMKVPLILYSPRNTKMGTRIKTPVTLLDIAPTVMEMMGFNNYPAFMGRNILEAESWTTWSFFEETYRPEAVKEKFAIHNIPWQLILTPEDMSYELYNLETDPGQQSDLYPQEGDSPSIAGLKKELIAFARKVLKDKVEYKIDTKTEEMLKSLGYIK